MKIAPDCKMHFFLSNPPMNHQSPSIHTHTQNVYLAELCASCVLWLTSFTLPSISLSPQTMAALTKLCLSSPIVAAAAGASPLSSAAAAAGLLKVKTRPFPVVLPQMSDAVVAPAVIVGCGRVGRMLQSLGDGRDVVVCRGQTVPEDFEGPILVCTRNDDLEDVLDATPKSRWNDLVFFQNGMIEPWLQCKHLSNANQVLAYFAVSKIGESPIDGKTDTNPQGLTAAYGKWAQTVAARLHSGGLSCTVLGEDSFHKQMMEKLIWISAFMLVGARHPGATVGVVEKDYREEVATLISELTTATTTVKGMIFDDGVVDRLCAYARAVSHFPTAVKEFKWRNGWFYSLSEEALQGGRPDPCPLHTAWLKEVKVI